MLYKIINMSDPYTIECPDIVIATVACVLLGKGQYAFDPVEEGISVPIMLFDNAEPFFIEHCGGTLVETITKVRHERTEELATALESVVIDDRDEYLRGLALAIDPITFRDKWLDEHRSSMNNIGGRAYALAANLRKDPQSSVAVPRQVYVV